MSALVHPAQLQMLRERIGNRTGLNIHTDRELDEALDAAASGLPDGDSAEFLHQLSSSPCGDDLVDLLVPHLTIGETYFFRDSKAMDALARHVLPGLLASRRENGRYLNIWSAGCCTGEEPYSLAILLRQLIPERGKWRLNVLANDINPVFVKKAKAATYGEWSFRGTPADLRLLNFEPASAGLYRLLPAIANMVRFSCASLLDFVPFMPVGGLDGMDLIVCRNVLMYLSPEAIRRAVQRFNNLLAPGGWLLVSPSETSAELFAGFEAVELDGALFYRKPLLPVQPVAAEVSAAQSLAAATPVPATCRTAPPPDWAAHARALADRGHLAEALESSGRWIEADSCNPSAHYLHAMILLEKKESSPALAALRRAIYLDPYFVMAHVAFGKTVRADSAPEAQLHLAHARALLAKQHADARVPEGDGITASQLIRMIDAIKPVEAIQ